MVTGLGNIFKSSPADSTHGARAWEPILCANIGPGTHSPETSDVRALDLWVVSTVLQGCRACLDDTPAPVVQLPSGRTKWPISRFHPSPVCCWVYHSIASEVTLNVCSCLLSLQSTWHLLFILTHIPWDRQDFPFYKCKTKVQRDSATWPRT